MSPFAPARLATISLADAALALDRGDFTAVELARASLDRIAAVDSRVNAFRAIDRDGVLAAAAAADERRRAGRTLSALDGLPISVKDNFMTRGLPTTCSSRMLEKYMSPDDAAAVERLRGAGLAMIGKTNLDEFARGTTGEHCAWGPVRNPWNLERVPGGSSSGPAAATAYGGGLAGLASDTGGSIRAPAAFCGLVGMKPTYGRVSRRGLAALASSLDHVGVLARSVIDAALLLDVLSGHDPLDGTSSRRSPTRCAEAVGAAGAGSARGARLGWLPAWLDAPETRPEIAAAFRAAMDAFRSAGAEFVELPLPRIRHAFAAYNVICPCEAYTAMARYTGLFFGRRGDGGNWAESMLSSRSEGLGLGVKRRILSGAWALSADRMEAMYGKAARVRRVICDDLNEALTRCDAIFLPTVPAPAPRPGELAGDPQAAGMVDFFTIPANLAGLPAVSLPIGLVEGMPAGAQLVGRAWEEAAMLQIARALEIARPDWTFAGLAPEGIRL